MKDPKVQEAVNRLRELFAELNELTAYFYEEGVNFSIQEKSGGGNGAKTFEISYLSQSVKYD